MCGISGWFDLNSMRPPNIELVQRMNLSIAHRGPDGDGFYAGPGVALGHRRLAIIDIATGQQPMMSADEDRVISFNGEIYNYRQLRQELVGLGHRFKTNSDTEVILEAWGQWGEGCLSRIRGMFAFALFDARRQSLLLARDRLGEKPLYYLYLSDGTLIFASELKAIEQCSSWSKAVDPTAVDDFFAFGYVPDPKTIYRDVRKLEAGHYLLLERFKPNRSLKYWDLAGPTSKAPGGTQNLQDSLVARLSAAVSSQLVADVPVGTFLSGGVDSSAITALASMEAGRPLSTFTIGFDERSWDERAYARAVGDRYRAVQQSEVVQSDDFETLAALPSVYDEPFGDSSALPTYRLCKLAARTVKVALSGDGGDELFAGYRRYPFHLAEEKWRSRLPASFRRSVFGGLGRIYPQFDWLPRRMRAKQTFVELGVDSAEGYFENIRALGRGIHNQILNQDIKKSLQSYRPSDLIRQLMAQSPYREPLGMAQYVDIKTWLVSDILTKVDRAAMACGLEVRVPMLDPQFVEWAMGLGAEFKLRKGEGKWLLKKAFEPYLPHDLLYRPKQGFSVPLKRWFKGPLAGEFERILDEKTLISSFIDIAFARRLLAEHRQGWADHSRALWLIWSFNGFLGRRA